MVDRILRIWRATDAGKEGAPVLVAGDQETYRFIAKLTSNEPEAYDQIRRYPEDWHLLLHMGKALLQRYWGAGNDLVARTLGTDDRKSGEGGNYRRTHQHLIVTYEALWSLSQDKCLKEFEESNDGPWRGDADDLAVMVVRWIELQAEHHKTFALWKQFLLHDYGFAHR